LGLSVLCVRQLETYEGRLGAVLLPFHETKRPSSCSILLSPAPQHRRGWVSPWHEDGGACLVGLQPNGSEKLRCKINFRGMVGFSFHRAPIGDIRQSFAHPPTYSCAVLHVIWLRQLEGLLGPIRPHSASGCGFCATFLPVCGPTLALSSHPWPPRHPRSPCVESHGALMRALFLARLCCRSGINVLGVHCVGVCASGGHLHQGP
jgi:hypothetical protein